MTAVGVVALLPAVALERQRLRGPPRYQFFDADEARFIEAACERLIPADDGGPGASDAGVPEYLDRQLAGAWGAGEQLYRAGTWQPGSPILASPSALTPAALYRTALGAINHELESRGTPFSRLAFPAQNALLAALQTGDAHFPGVPTQAFFASLLLMTVEAFFSNPFHGPRRDRIAWQLCGFPGAHAAMA